MKVRGNYYFSSVLEEFLPEYYLKGNIDIEFDKILFWDGVYRPDTLFLVKASMLPESLPALYTSVTMVCILDCELPNWYISAKEVQIIALQPGLTLEVLYNRLSERCALDLTFSELANLTDIARNKGLADIVESIGYLIRGSVVLTDSQFIVLAASRKANGEYYNWEEHLKKYYYNQDLKNQSWRQMVFFDRRIGRMTHEVITEDACDVLFPIVNEVESKGILGYLVFMLDEVPDLEKAGMVLEYIRPLISRQLWKAVNIFQLKYHNRIRVFEQILNGILRNDEQIADALRNISFCHMPCYQMIVVAAETSYMEHREDQMKRVFEDVWSKYYEVEVFEHNSAIIILLKSREEIVLQDEMLKAFEKVLRETEYRAGISEMFFQIDKYFRHYFKRAVSAAVEGIHEQWDRRCTFFKDIIMDHIIWSCFSQDRELGYELIDPAVIRLMDYDSENNTHFLDTLRCYWHYNKQTKPICNYLHIQKSTLFYRLKKIGEIQKVKTDVNDFSGFLNFRVSLSLLEYYHKLRPVQYPVYEEE